MTAESKTVLITGASSGIGATFARRLAASNTHLILVARRRERLDALAGELADQCGATAEALVADLSTPEGMACVEDQIASLPGLDVLVNNAGFGTRTHFAEIDLAMHVDMINVHVTASVRLTRVALPAMIERGRGDIINVSSMAGFLAMPYTVTYCATKAYLITFSQGLAKELTGTGVRVQALCPGFTYTEFHDQPQFESFDRSFVSKRLWMSGDDVVAESLRALGKNESVCVPGRMNRMLLRFQRSPIGPILLRMVAKKRWE